jgi:predicted GH43/DUF377 family glycosyl hydrolase
VPELFARRPRWKKLGLVVRPQADRWWWRSHAMTPTLMQLESSKIRLYFSGRNDANQSHVGWATIDLARPDKVIDSSVEPVLKPGALGCFDDNGVTPSSIVRSGNELLLYYIGWNPGSTVRVHLFGGLAISRDNGATFERWSRAPILERVPVNPFLNTAPFVMREGNRWRMYYVAGTAWRHKDLPRYNIQIAESDDGKHWRRDGKVAIDFQSDHENALARPFVLKEDGVYKMWFAHKGEVYRMGYAESVDGLSWVRDDSFGALEPTAGTFDGEMIEYFAVAVHEGRKIVFYNGNNYGQDGIGVAVED